MLNLDTHILIFTVLGKLSAKEESILRQTSAWCISDIVLWEITKLSQMGRIGFDLESAVIKDLLGHLEVLPIDESVCVALKKLDFKSDPADEIIAATSLAHDIPLLTRDTIIKKSKIVPLAK